MFAVHDEESDWWADLTASHTQQNPCQFNIIFNSDNSTFIIYVSILFHRNVTEAIYELCD